MTSNIRVKHYSVTKDLEPNLKNNWPLSSEKTADNYLNITPEDRICMFERFYHPGPRGNEYGKKSRSILGENSNSSLNWTQTLETHHRLLNQPINPLDRNGRDRLINDTPRVNGFAY